MTPIPPYLGAALAGLGLFLIGFAAGLWWGTRTATLAGLRALNELSRSALEHMEGLNTYAKEKIEEAVEVGIEHGRKMARWEP